MGEQPTPMEAMTTITGKTTMTGTGILKLPKATGGTMGDVDPTFHLTMGGLANVTPTHGQMRRAHAAPTEAGAATAVFTATAGQSALTTARSNLLQMCDQTTTEQNGTGQLIY